MVQGIRVINKKYKILSLKVIAIKAMGLKSCYTADELTPKVGFIVYPNHTS